MVMAKNSCLLNTSLSCVCSSAHLIMLYRPTLLPQYPISGHILRVYKLLVSTAHILVTPCMLNYFHPSHRKPALTCDDVMPACSIALWKVK